MSVNRTTSLTEAPRLSAAQVARIAVARLYARLGWPGCAGALMLIAAALSMIWLHQESLRAFQQHQKARQNAIAAASALANSPLPATLRVSPPALPRGAESVAVLKRVQTIVQASGLTWPQADYRLTALSDEGLATLEIRTTLKGPYPQLRQLITTLLDKEPALALRELNLTRPNGDTPEVEAKVRWVVFLADGWAPAEAGGLR